MEAAMHPVTSPAASTPSRLTRRSQNAQNAQMHKMSSKVLLECCLLFFFFVCVCAVGLTSKCPAMTLLSPDTSMRSKHQGTEVLD